MKEFPAELTIENKEHFSEYIYKRWKCYLRRDITEHMLANEEKDYFDLDKFVETHAIKDRELAQKMLREIEEELNKIGWKTTISFGGNGMFIYADKKPANCWAD